MHEKADPLTGTWFFLQNPHEKPNSVECGYLPASCAHVLVCMLTDGPGPELNPWLSHMPGSAALCRHPTACARARKSETEKGLALVVAKAWHLHLGKLAHRVPVGLLGSRNTLLICRKDIDARRWWQGLYITLLLIRAGTQ